MLNLAFWITIAPAGLVLALTPGPSNLLSVHVAAAEGMAAACRAGLGRLAALALILALAALGLAALLRVAPWAVPLLQTAAALYLLILAARLARAVPPAAEAAPGAGGAALRREFFVALGNPKFLVIATAFVPQCIDPGRPAGPQLAAVSLLVLLLELAAIAAYASAGRGLQRWLSTPARWRAFGQASAAAMAAAALVLLGRLWA